MAYRIPIEIYVGEVEWQIIKDNNINVVELCIDAVKTRIDALNVMKQAVHSATNTHVEVIQLRTENERLKALQAPKVEMRVVSTEAPKPKSPEQIYMKAAMKHQAIKKPMTVEDLYE